MKNLPEWSSVHTPNVRAYLNHSLIVCSDLHLRGPEDPRTEILCALLTALTDAVREGHSSLECFVLNGDIFDFCFGDSVYFRKKFCTVGDHLTALSRTGVKVVCTEGNHEFGMSLIGWEGVTFCEGAFTYTVQADQSTWAFYHGDRLGAPWHYYVYCAVVHHPVFLKCLHYAPQGGLDALALSLAKTSRMSDGRRTLDHGRILYHAEKWLKGTGAQYGVIGHFHHPYEHTGLNGHRIFCVPSWNTPNFISYAQGTHFRWQV